MANSMANRDSEIIIRIVGDGTVFYVAVGRTPRPWRCRAEALIAERIVSWAALSISASFDEKVGENHITPARSSYGWILYRK